MKNELAKYVQRLYRRKEVFELDYEGTLTSSSLRDMGTLAAQIKELNEIIGNLCDIVELDEGDHAPTADRGDK